VISISPSVVFRKRFSKSLTSKGLNAEKSIQPTSKPLVSTTQPEFIQIQNATANNLKNVSVNFPKNLITTMNPLSVVAQSSLQYTIKSTKHFFRTTI